MLIVNIIPSLLSYFPLSENKLNRIGIIRRQLACLVFGTLQIYKIQQGKICLENQ